MTILKKIKIFGERCSGTTYLAEVLRANFDVEVLPDIHKYGRKHFFGFNDLSDSDDILFIGIIRELEDWINSLYRSKHHLPSHLLSSKETFLTGEFYSINYNKDEIMDSINDNKDEIMEDRNIITKERYKNIFELRDVKNEFLIKTMPKKVKNYCFITYDNLVNHFNKTMHTIKKFKLHVKEDIKFPLNINYYKEDKSLQFVKKKNEIKHELIDKFKKMSKYEKLLFPIHNAPK
jgi:hypothetical protein